jgi:hypothetical protein
MTSRFDIGKKAESSLTGASEFISADNPASPKMIRGRQQNWQRRVFAFSDAVPEVGAAARWIYNAVNKVEFKSENGNAAIDAELQLLDAGRIAQHLMLVGESYLLSGEKIENRWEELAPGEYEYEKGKSKYRVNSGSMAPVPAGTDILRVFIPQPKDRFAADSVHRGMLDLLEALYLHQLADVTLGGSRAAWAGFQYIPANELTENPPGHKGEPEPGTREWLAQDISRFLRESITKGGDRDKVLMPYLLFGDAEYADGLKHMLPERSDDGEGFTKRIEGYVKRYARTTGVPAEVILGYEDASHWSAYKMSEDGYRYYVAPLVKVITDVLTRLYSERANSLVTITADPQALISKPDLTDAAIRLFQLGALSAEAAIVAAGFKIEDVGSGVAVATTPNTTGENQHSGVDRTGQAPRAGTGSVV